MTPRALVLLLLACSERPGKDESSGEAAPSGVAARTLTEEATCPATFELPAGTPIFIRVFQSTETEDGPGWERYLDIPRFRPGAPITLECDESLSDGDQIRLAYTYEE